MDADYIIPRLKKIAELAYGKDAKCYAEKHGKSYYIFGSFKIKNKVSKAIAITLVMNKMPTKKKKK